MSNDPRHLSVIVEDGAKPDTSKTREDAPVSPVPESPTRLKHGRGRSASRVSIDHFDPQGVHALERQMTQESLSAVARRPKVPHPQHRSSDSSHTLGSDCGLGDGSESFDFSRALRGMMRKAEEANIKHRTLGVSFRDLRVVGVGSSAAFADNVGSLFSPRVTAEKIRGAMHPVHRDILTGFEGVVKPGEMLLVLGRPGSGCSTFLKVLANQRYQYKAVHGSVQYDSITSEQLEKHYRGDVLYCPEDDVHFPTLRVGETLEFAATTRTPQRRIADMPRKSFIQRTTDVMTTVFGLTHTRKTKVGDASIRGVSGGEKKRVSIAEAMLGHAKFVSWDNSTRGLDASTALEFGRALRIATDTFGGANAVSLYQASENLYDLFDKVCVIYEGRMAYFGPADRARQYFMDLGYEPANRQTTPDFLVAVTDPLSRIQRSDALTAPRASDEFARAFLESEIGKRNRVELDEYERDHVGKTEIAQAYKESAHEEHAKTARNKSPYMISVPMQVRAVMKRRVQIIRGQMLFTVLNTVSFIIQGIIMGTVFWQSAENTGAYFSRGGILFFSLLFAALTAMAEIPALYAQRPIVHRQMRAAMYHPFIEAAAMTLVDIPLTFITIVFFTIIVYFFVGLQRTAEQYFIFLLFVFAMSIVMKAWFRAIAAAFRSEPAAQAFAGLSILVLAIYTGYTIPRPSIVTGLRWVTWINPLRYGFEAIMTNEFRTLNGECSNVVPSGPGYENVAIDNTVCSTVGSQPGQSTVSGAAFTQISYGFTYSNTWRNFGILIGWGVLFITALLTLTERNTDMAVETGVTHFKRTKRNKDTVKASATDPEKGSPGLISGEATVVNGTPRSTSSSGAAPEDRAAGISKEAQRALDGVVAKVTDVFTWRDVRYTVQTAGGEERTLLNDVSGYVAPGKLTALMGESGAGKTTLLNVLAQRVDTGVVTGDMLVNGHPLPRDFQAQTGYCQQTDTHLPQNTVREALVFSAKLRQPAEVPISEKEAYADKCLMMCGLEDYADAIVGTLGVEHRKRLTIGVELAAKPKLLLFLDEPTSGLDSQSAWAIMAFLRSLAEHGQAILCTIHQPSAELFQVFDRVLLLQKGGKTVYFGDLGENSTTLIHYFERNGARHCDSHENPAEYMLEAIGAGATAQAKQDWHQSWLNSPERHTVQEEIDQFHREGEKKGAVQTALKREFATTWFYQVRENLARLAVAYWRDPSYVMAKFALSALGGLIIGFTFFTAPDSQQGTQNKLFAIFMATILSVPLSNQTQVPFINVRNIYEIRERPSRMYNWTALVTAQILVEIPLNMLTASAIFLTWFWTVGFENSRAGFMFLTLVVAFPMYYQTFSQAVAAMSPSVEIAGLLFSFLFSFVITFNGVMQPFRQLGWWKWMYRLSPYTYLIEALLGQAIGKQDINCAPQEFVTLNPPAGQTCGTFLGPYISNMGGYLQDENATSGCNFCSTRTTDEFMGGNFNVFYSNHWRDFGLVMAYVAFNIFLVFSLTYLFRIRTGPLISFKRRK
ncbi:pleiotropic drug resistance ABC transporter [Auriculariales sp. MPI-PUGE-AT-0066]|nr:pleiotropic drug resistance ABC transporter [Auriculariales sp. MPI-PUGE-AT-0066]